MDKEQLKTKVEVLQANAETKQEELTEVLQRLNVARDELTNADKPILSQDDMVNLVDLLQGMFHDILNDADTSDLSPEFSIEYDNTVVLDCLDMSSIEVHSGDIESVLEQVFNIVSDNS
jgi:hypothetical protein